MAINWDDIYSQKWKESEQGYGDIKKSIDDAQIAESGELQKKYNEGLKTMQQTRDESLNQAYVNMRQNQRQLPSLMKQNGLNGGATESATASLLRNYQNSRNAANNTYQKAEGDYTSNYNTNAASLKARYNQQLAELLSKQKEDVWNKTQFAYNAAKYDEELKENQKHYEAQIADQKAQYEQQLKTAAEERAEDKRRFDLQYQQQQQQAQLAQAQYEQAIKDAIAQRDEDKRRFELEFAAKYGLNAANGTAAQTYTPNTADAGTSAASVAQQLAAASIGGTPAASASTSSTSNLSPSDKYFANGGNINVAVENLSKFADSNQKLLDAGTRNEGANFADQEYREKIYGLPTSVTDKIKAYGTPYPTVRQQLDLENVLRAADPKADQTRIFRESENNPWRNMTTSQVYTKIGANKNYDQFNP